MNFIYKCYLQKLFSVIPKGEKLNYFFQKYITKSYPINKESFIKQLSLVKDHFDAFSIHTQLADVQDATYYEFGAGWDLISPICLSLIGFRTLHCIDIRRLVFPELLNDTIRKFQTFKKDIPFDYSLQENIPIMTKSNYQEVLMKYFGINYQAPIDARHTNFQEQSIDFITSNATFEHIPKDDIISILNESYRILKKGGILSCQIDYRDHWSYFDHSISMYNFLKYTPTQWTKYCPSLHYQNRLRHRDYLDIISQTDFEVLTDKPILPSSEELDILGNLRINTSLTKKYTLEELAIKGSQIILRK